MFHGHSQWASIEVHQQELYRQRAEEYRRREWERVHGKSEPKPTIRKVTIVSNTLWCDTDDKDTNIVGQVGHPFSDKDPDKHRFTETKMVKVATGNSYGTRTFQEREEVTVEIHMCGYHYNKINPFHSAGTVAGELETEKD